MKLLVMGHYSHTGLGIVTEALAVRFLERGIDVRILAVNHRGEPVTGVLSGRVWPFHVLRDHFKCNITIAALTGQLWLRFDCYEAWIPDQILFIADHGGLLDYIGKDGLAAFENRTAWHYCPIEGDNLPASWSKIWDTIHPVAMSKFGQAIIEGNINRQVPMIYHGVDPIRFHPVTDNSPAVLNGQVLCSKSECKQVFGLDPASVVILRTDRLQERKFYHALLNAMTPILSEDSQVALFIHCCPQDGGLDIDIEIARMPPSVQSQVHVLKIHDTFQGLSSEALMVLYNAADLYVSTTGGEGFGLTLAESLACGVPVVTTGYAAGVEVVGPGGILVPPLRDEHGNEIAYHTPYQMDWRMPNVPGFTNAIRQLVARPDERNRLGLAGCRHVLKSFSWDQAADQFIRLFESNSTGKH